MGTDGTAQVAWPRSFLALAPDRATRARLAAVPIRPRSTPTHIDDLHLTLAFIGGISDAQRHLLAGALPALAEDIGPIPPLAPLGVDAWPSPDRPRVWVALYALPDPLRRLVETVQRLLATADLPVDTRPFRPHVTLARFARGAGQIAPATDIHLDGAATFHALGLFCRADSPGGARYATLASVPLR
jgi:2'-5' RNA ligase